MQHGSSSLSKTPYVGFSPIRLQTGIQPRLSPMSAGLSTRSAFTRPTPTYTWLKLLVQRGVSPQRCWFSRSQALSSSGAPFTLANNTPVQRPLADQRVGLPTCWLANGLCCPIRSSFTMASSETLDPPIDLSITTMGLCPTTLYGLGLPNLLRASFPSVPPSVPRWTKRLHMAVPSPFVLAFAFFAQARHPQPTPPVLVWNV